MRYLIVISGHQPFLTPYYNPNNYTPGMTVYDLDELIYTSDGRIWNDIPLDHL